MITTDTTPVQRLAGLAAIAEGSIVSRMLLKNKGGNVTLFAFGEGQGLSEHTAPFDALVIGVEGEGEVTLAGEAHRVSAGDTITLPAGVPHAVHAVADFKMLLVMLRA
jgi:quercetin dioxygenase-like cupin family protein